MKDLTNIAINDMDLDGARAALHELRAEVARLRAGESSEPVDDGVVLSPAEWIRGWNDASSDTRTRIVYKILEKGEQADRCFVVDHGGQIQYLRSQYSFLLDVANKALLASLANEGAAKHWTSEDYDIAVTELWRQGSGGSVPANDGQWIQWLRD